MDNKKLPDVVPSLEEKVKENSEKLEQLRKRVEKLENPAANQNIDVNDNLSNLTENALLDVNNKLSNYAQKTAKDSRGPLKPDELLTHFTSNDFGKKKKEAMAVMGKFPNNIDEVKRQLSDILDDLEIQVTRRKQENELDVQLIQRIRKFNETVEKEQEKRKESDTKVKLESNPDQSQIVMTRSAFLSSKVGITGKSRVSKQEKPVKQAEKRGRKRKLKNYDDEDNISCSSQEVEVEQVAVGCKRLKLNSSTSSQGTIELIMVDGSPPFREYRHPRPIIDSESSQSSADSTETFEKAKTTGKRSKQPESDGDEETVHEKQLTFKGKHIR